MTLDTKTTAESTAVKPEQHHAKVAEHLELAAKSHKEVAKHIGANDHAAAQAQAKVADEHFAKAQEHMTSAKKAMPAAK